MSVDIEYDMSSSSNEVILKMEEHGKGQLEIPSVYYMNWYLKTQISFLDIDYDQSALIHGCQSFAFGLFHVDYFWVLSREKTLDQETTRRYMDKIKDNYPAYLGSNTF